VSCSITYTPSAIGSQTLTASYPGDANHSSSSGTLAFTSAPRLSVVASTGTATAGTALSVTVTAVDQFGATFIGYRGTVHFTTTDGQAVLPADYTFVGADNGAHTFSVTLKTAGNQTVTATDTAASVTTGTTGQINVAAAAASKLAVSASPTTVTAGNALSVTVTAQDPFGNTAPSYRGTVHFTSSDPNNPTLPTDYTFIASDNGVHTFSNAVTLKTAGGRTITATDTVTSSITGTSGTITVNPAPANKLVFGQSQPTPCRSWPSVRP
jgi:hypothetical protein